MHNPLSDILIILLLLMTNGVFAMSEMAIVSARKVRLQQLSEEGNRRAQAALKLANSPNRLLSTIQIGITLIGVLSGAFGEATLAAGIASWIKVMPALEPYSEAIGVAIVVTCITYLSLVIGELAPKRLALNNAERIAMFVASPMTFLATLASPLVKLLSVSTDFVLKVLQVKPSTDPLITQEEIEILIEQGTQSGVFVEAEQDILESVLRLDEQWVGAVMTARPQIVWLDLDDDMDTICEKIVQSPHSRFPVCKDDLDNIFGIVNVKDILKQTFEQAPLDLKALSRLPLFVPESMFTLKLLELFKRTKTHIAMVVDEYGVILGMITDTDILENIVGDLPAIDEPEELDIVQREDGSWLVEGILPIERIKKLLDIEKFPDEDINAYQTLAGFIVYQIGSIPVAGECCECEGWRFEVMDMDGRRVDKVLIIPVNDGEGDDVTL